MTHGEEDIQHPNHGVEKPHEQPPAKEEPKPPEAPAPPVGNPLGHPVVRGILRALLPLMISLLPRGLGLLANGQLTWEAFTRGTGFLVSGAILSIVLFVDLAGLSQSVPRRLSSRTLTLMISYFVFFCVVFTLYTLYIGEEIQGIVTPEAYMKMRNLEFGGVVISGVVLVLNVIAIVLEVWKKIP